MKNKIMILILIVIIIVVGVMLIVTNSKKNDAKRSDSSVKETLKEKSNDKNNILVTYFSVAGEVYNVGEVKVGNTAIVASYIKEYLNADSFEIEPVKPYTTVYNDLIEVAKEEQKNNARPEIKNKIDDFDKYDTVFIGYPIWWGDLPPIINTFLEEYDFSGKDIYLFNTHEGSGDAGTYNTIKNKLKKSDVNTNGLALQGKKSRTDDGRDETIKWLKELGY